MKRVLTWTKKRAMGLHPVRWQGVCKRGCCRFYVKNQLGIWILEGETPRAVFHESPFSLLRNAKQVARLCCCRGRA